MQTSSPLEFDTFKITLITPALLSAADTSKADTNGLRGSSLRGMWRFWARAIWKGLNDDLTVKQMKELEAGLFGDTDTRSFRMKIETQDENLKAKAYPLPHKPGRYGHFSLGSLKDNSTYTVIIYWPPSWNLIYKKALASIIVLWSVLGSIGQRSRRGFGSVRMHDGKNQGVFYLATLLGQKDLNFPAAFNDTVDLKSFIETVIVKTAEIQISYINELGITGAQNKINLPLNGKKRKDMFFLQSLEQVMVGKELGNSLYDMDKINNNEEDRTGVIYKIHGKRNAVRDERGDGPRRLASPIYIRLHKVGNQFVPVATISYRKQHNEFSQPFKNWLSDLGLQSLGTGGPSSAPGASSPNLSSVGSSSTGDEQAWEIPPDKQQQKPRRSKQPVEQVWEKFNATKKLQELIKNICLIDGVIKVIPDMASYKKTGGKTTVPNYETFKKMSFTCATSDGQVNVELKLTCNTKNQWYYIRREIKRAIDRL